MIPIVRNLVAQYDERRLRHVAAQVKANFASRDFIAAVTRFRSSFFTARFENGAWSVQIWIPDYDSHFEQYWPRFVTFIYQHLPSSGSVGSAAMGSEAHKDAVYDRRSVQAGWISRIVTRLLTESSYKASA
jgi:hypothetical protein